MANFKSLDEPRVGEMYEEQRRLREKAARKERVKEHFYQGIENFANFVSGYVQEQIFTTLNFLPFDLKNKYLAEHPPKERTFYNEDDEKERRKGDWSAGTGIFAGIVQDAASMALAVNYASGGDSRLANIAAGVVATKIGLNILSLAAQGVYLRLERNAKLEEERARDSE